MIQLVVTKCPSDTHALANVAYLHPSDMNARHQHICINRDFYYACRGDPAIPTGHIGLSTVMRGYMGLALGERVTVDPFDPLEVTTDCYLDTVVLGVGLLRRARVGESYQFDAGKMGDLFREQFHDQVMSIGQPMVMESSGVMFRLTVHDLRCVNLQALSASPSTMSKQQHQQQQQATNSIIQKWGVVMAQSGVLFTTSPDDHDSAQAITITNQPDTTTNGAIMLTAHSHHPIIQPNFKFEDMGIGGLASEFGVIFRRAFASRIFPPQLIAKLGIQHVKGVLLHGPPGTGKTLIARQIGKMLNAREPKIVNGPEILNKYVGQSEENVRNLFKDAEAEYKQKGDASQLHIIIFDELDAVCRQRGARSGDSTGVGDQVVNQLLSKMDGVEQLNNILVIGMTNRLDLIDEALLRPGRMEVHLEIGLPDEAGRLEIFKIHTSKMRHNNLLSSDVDLTELAGLAKNYSGAEITGVVKSAASFAFNRHVRVNSDPSQSSSSHAHGGMVETDMMDVSELMVTRDDFMAALQEVPASFGRNDTELSVMCRLGIIEYEPQVGRLIADCQLVINQVRQSTRPSPMACILLHGLTGSGKTAMAAHLAAHSAFPFIKVLSAESMIGMSEGQRVNAIHRVFSDAHRSPLSLVIVDEVERLLDYVAIGPRFMNGVLQCLLVLLKQVPSDAHHRLLVIATTSDHQLLRDMGMSELFTVDHHVPAITTVDDLTRVIKATLADQPDRQQDLIRAITARLVSGAGLAVPIKKALSLIDMAAQDQENGADLFVHAMEPYLVHGSAR